MYCRGFSSGEQFLPGLFLENKTPCMQANRKRSTWWVQHEDLIDPHQSHQSASILRLQICLHFSRRPLSRCSPDQQICLFQHSSTYTQSWLRPRSCVVQADIPENSPKNHSCSSARPWGAKGTAGNSLSHPLSQRHCLGNTLEVATGCSHLPGQAGARHCCGKPPPQKAQGSSVQ